MHHSLYAAAAIALVAGAAHAQPAAQPITLPSDEAVPGAIAAHIYLNVATGEVIINQAPARPRLDDLLFANWDGQCGFFFQTIDNPSRDPALGREPLGSAAVHWADIAERSLVSAFTVTYTTNLRGDGGPGEPEPIPGFNLVVTFLQNYEGDLDPGGTLAAPLAAFRIESIYGSDAWEAWGGGCGFLGICGAMMFVDLEGSGLEFMLGDPDAGALDLDDNGLYDFGYSYQFEQPGPPFGTAGVCLVQPASFGGQGTATTAPDAMEWFNQGDGPFTGYAGRYWFGGGQCPARPWASYYLELFGTTPASACEPIDYTADGLIDFSDYLTFLSWYDAGQSPADLNADGLVDFSDYLFFINLYDICD